MVKNMNKQELLNYVKGEVAKLAISLSEKYKTRNIEVFEKWPYDWGVVFTDENTIGVSVFLSIGEGENRRSFSTRFGVWSEESFRECLMCVRDWIISVEKEQH